MNLLEHAKKTMELAHKGQTRWDGHTPYSVHPIKVVEILKYYGINDEELLIAGYLHDVLEDTDFKKENLQKNFGSRVTSLVEELTFITDDYDLYIQHVSELTRDAKWIKLADILANLGDSEEKSTRYVSKRIKSLQIILKELLQDK